MSVCLSTSDVVVGSKGEERPENSKLLLFQNNQFHLNLLRFSYS